MVVCNQCGREFTQISNLHRHERTLHGSSKYQCHSCGQNLSRKDALNRQAKTWTTNQPAPKCPRLTSDTDEEESASHVLNQLVDAASNETATALNGAVRSYKIYPNESVLDPVQFMNSCNSQIENILTVQLAGSQAGFKMLLCLSVNLFKPVNPEETTKAHFRSQQHVVLKGSHLEPEITSAFPKILESMATFQREGSGWAVERINFLDVILVKYQPLQGSTYKPLPSRLRNKHAIVNIQNHDNQCFKYCILSALFRQMLILSVCPSINSIAMDIGRFEQMNNLAINVYGFRDDSIYPLRISKVENKPMIHLLLQENHYSLIKDLNRVLFDIRKDGHRKYFCPRCLTPKYAESLLEQHMVLCKQQEPTKTTMPEDTHMQFSNFNKMIRQPIVVYADLECLTSNISPMENNGRYQRHIPCGVGLVEVQHCCNLIARIVRDPIIIRLRSCLEHFFLELMKIIIEYHNLLDSAKDVRDFDPSRHAYSICHICQKAICVDKIVEHCHICGAYRGPAHKDCSVKYCLNRDIVIVFHNLRRYDGHLLMQELENACKLHGFEVNVIARSMEDYLSFSLVHCKEHQSDRRRKLRFIDSLQFLNSSLSNLVSNLPRDHFKILGQRFGPNNLDNLIRKQVYPYDHMDDWSKFDQTSLPPHAAFYNQLNEENIDLSDYQHAQKVWRLFNIKTMGEFHDLYLTIDVLQLADIFEQFRNFALDSYRLDSVHYVSAPSLAWDACLLMTGVRLELLQDPEMYLFLSLQTAVESL